MGISRRDFLAGAATLAGATMLPHAAKANNPLSFVDTSPVDPSYLEMRLVEYNNNTPQGTYLINRQLRKLYLNVGRGLAIEYPIAVGREGTGRYDAQYYIARKA